MRISVHLADASSGRVKWQLVSDVSLLASIIA